MYDIDLKNVKKGRKLPYIFIAIALVSILILGGIVGYSIFKRNSLDSVVLSTHVDIKESEDDDGDTMYSPVYYYTVNGVDYSCGSSSYSGRNPGYENKNVYYDSKDPSRCMSEYSESNITLLSLIMIAPALFGIVGIVLLTKVNKRIKSIKELNERGKLVKNLPYTLENTGTIINGVAIQRPVVSYKLPTGIMVSLYGEPRYDQKTSDDDGMVDILIDENNPDNYFVDFEINRLSGNRPSDYYEKPDNDSSYDDQGYN